MNTTPRKQNKCYRHRCLWLLIVWAALWLFNGCQTSGEIAPLDFQITARQWPLADKLFRSEPQWLGADGAHSIDLEDGRILWLFGDSFIDTIGTSRRSDAVLIRNSVALQQGYDPLTALVEFRWGGTRGHPQSFFRNSGKTWLWPGHGVRLNDHLLIFLLQIEPADNTLGFAQAGTKVARLAGIDLEPAQWRLTWLDLPTHWNSRPWAAARVLKFEGFIYCFLADAAADHRVYLVRWPQTAAARGNLGHPQWWAGDNRGWILFSELHGTPATLFTHGQAEFTVHYDPTYERFFQFQTIGFGATDIGYRSAPHITGPWSAPMLIYRPPEHETEQILIYGAQAHPALMASDLVLTYSTNHLNSQLLLGRSDLYYPRFVQCRILPRQ